jgi:hypothetical protein
MKGYDFTGHILPTNNLRLIEIEGVCQFASKLQSHTQNTKQDPEALKEIRLAELWKSALDGAHFVHAAASESGKFTYIPSFKAPHEYTDPKNNPGYSGFQKDRG